MTDEMRLKAYFHYWSLKKGSLKKICLENIFATIKLIKLQLSTLKILM